MYLHGKPTYGIDFGGTKIAIGEVDRKTGKLTGRAVTLPTPQFAGNGALTESIRRALPEEPCNVGIGVAGLVDEKTKTISKVPNARIMGDITFAADLASLGFNVKITNDMPAAITGAAEFGNGCGHIHVALGTFSSGNNYAVARSGLPEPVRMEAGHCSVPFPKGRFLSWLAEPPQVIAARSAALLQIRQYFFIRGQKEAGHHLVLEGMTNFNRYAAKSGLRPLAEGDLKASRAAFSLAVCFIRGICKTEPVWLGDDRDLRLDVRALESEPKLFCGCGGWGHMEPYVSGNGAASMAQQYLSEWFTPGHRTGHRIMLHALNSYNQDAYRRGPEYGSEDLVRKEAYSAVLGYVSAKGVYQAYRDMPDESPQKDIRDTQVEMIASSLGTLISHHSPLGVVVCMGSMTLDWDLIFEPAIRLLRENPADRFYMRGLKVPEIVRNTLDDIGIVGAAAYLLAKEGVLGKEE